MRSFTLVVAAVALTTPFFVAVNGAGFRCGFLSFLGTDWACRQSCKIQGHTTGACEGSKCVCSGETGGIADLLGKIKEQFDEFGEEVDSWEITQDIKGLVDKAQCGLSENICTTSCHSIGRVSGQCNADNTDCDCSDEKVSGTQYALCLDGGLCSAYCQTKERKAAGVCAGPTNWDCYCEDGDGNREAVGDVDMDNF